MLQLVNRTPYAAELFPMWDHDGKEVTLLIVKCTFEVGRDQTLGVAEEQVRVCAADEYYGDPAKSSIRVANDLALYKPYVDVIVIGSVYTPGGTARARLTVGLTVGKVRRFLRITGERTWARGLVDYRITDPVPFTEMSVTYERTYGGSDARSAEMRNPVGRGYCERQDQIAGSSLPNVEWDDAPLENWRGRPEPAGLGFVAPSWLPRSKYGGTYDDSWIENRMPFLPEDFDYRHFQAASPTLTFSTLHPGEPVVLESMTRDGNFAFAVPDSRLSAVYRHDVGRSEVELRRDTVVIEPDHRRVILISRALIPCHRNHLALREVLVGDLTPGMKRAFLTGKKYLGPERSSSGRTRHGSD
jgi:hypothetical protein